MAKQLKLPPLPKARVAPGLPGVAGRGAGLLASGALLRAERKMGQQHRGGLGEPRGEPGAMGLWMGRCGELVAISFVGSF